MKITISPWFKILGLSLLLGFSLGPTKSFGQVQVHQSPLEFTTIGGITYVEYTAAFLVCYDISTTTLVSGANVTITIVAQWRPDCVHLLCLDCDSYSETNTAVLGVLAPGDYLLQIYAPYDPVGSPFPGFAELQVMRFFSVTNAPANTLTLTTPTSANFTFQVAGVPDVRYVTETSSNLVQWLPAATNVGGPFFFSTARDVAETNRFYRTRILPSR